MGNKVTILGIESSCDDTAAAIVQDGWVLSNIMASQEVHKKYGGVVPELASRAHQQNIIPVVDYAIREAGIHHDAINAVAFTRGPGLMGSLLVGTSFAKGFALARQIPLIEVHHLQAHILAHFIKADPPGHGLPEFPFLCLLVSGGHTQLVIMEDYLVMRIIGQTIDDAAGEAFDKCAKVLGLAYPGGPIIDRLAQKGNPDAFTFAKPRVPDLDYSFSGLKTSFLYFVRDALKQHPGFIDQYKNDLAASLQKAIVDILLDKLKQAARLTGITQIGIAGGVSANSGLRGAVQEEARNQGWNLFIPPFRYTTDNAAMIAITGYYKYLNKQFTQQAVPPEARLRY